MKRKYAGFTLLELLITLFIIGIITSSVIPSFKQLVTDAHHFNTMNNLRGALSYARSEAITRHTVVRVCASDDGATCSVSKAWENGWITYLDLTGNSVRTTGDPILRHQSATNSLVIRKNGRERTVRFDKNGRIGLNRSFYICSNKLKPLNRLIVIHSGRIRTDKSDIQCIA